MPDRILIVATLGFLSGVVFAYASGVGALFALPLLVGIVWFSRLHVISFTLRQACVSVAIFLVCFSGGAIRFIISNDEPPDSFESRVGESMTVSGVVTNDPDQGDGVAVALIYTSGIGIRIKIQHAPSLRYGDTIIVQGTLAHPENFETEQGTEFDYISYLRKDRIFYLLQNVRLLEYTHETNVSLHRILYSFRHMVERIIFAIVPEQAAGLIAGILLGTKTNIPEDLYEALVRTSTVHIVALSGYNVSIVAETITNFFKTFLRPAYASVFGGLGIVLFVIMTGASSTAVRAGLMAILVIIARSLGRPAQALRVMAIAANVLVLYNPWYLVADASFQLSFLATLGLVLVSPIYVSRLSNYMPPLFAEALGTTLAAETAVAPFILYNMGVFSVVALPVNILIIPLVPMIMLSGFIGILIGAFSASLGIIVGYPAALLTSLLVWIIENASSFSFASVLLPNVSLVLTMICYTMITWYSVSYFLTKQDN